MPYLEIRDSQGRLVAETRVMPSDFEVSALDPLLITNRASIKARLMLPGEGPFTWHLGRLSGTLDMPVVAKPPRAGDTFEVASLRIVADRP
jgi:hypothetical protein